MRGRSNNKRLNGTCRRGKIKDHLTAGRGGAGMGGGNLDENFREGLVCYFIRAHTNVITNFEIGKVISQADWEDLECQSKLVTCRG